MFGDMAEVFFSVLIGIVALVFASPVLAVVGIVFLIRFLWRRAHGEKALKPGDKPTPLLEEGTSEKKVREIVSAYRDDAVLGSYVEGVLTGFDTCERRRTQITSILEQEFGTSSLTWDKFSHPVELANETILHNSVQLANRIQSFDSKEFQRMGRLEAAGAYESDSPQVKQLEVMRESLTEMDGIQADNDRLLAELAHLQEELQRLSGAGTSAETTEIAEELAKLAEQTKYYYRN